jgi:hypothetical protein
LFLADLFWPNRMESSFMMSWWRELALQKPVAQKNPKDLVVWLGPQESMSLDSNCFGN